MTLMEEIARRAACEYRDYPDGFLAVWVNLAPEDAADLSIKPQLWITFNASGNYFVAYDDEKTRCIYSEQEGTPKLPEDVAARPAAVVIAMAVEDRAKRLSRSWLVRPPFNDADDDRPGKPNPANDEPVTVRKGWKRRPRGQALAALQVGDLLHIRYLGGTRHARVVNKDRQGHTFVKTWNAASQVWVNKKRPLRVEDLHDVLGNVYARISR